MERSKRCSETYGFSAKRPREAFFCDDRVTFMLVYFKDDMTYLTMSSISRALPLDLQGTDLTKLEHKTSVILKNGWRGVVVATGHSEKALADRRAALEEQLHASSQAADVSLSRLERADESECDENIAREQQSEDEILDSCSENTSKDEESQQMEIHNPIVSELKTLNKSVAKLVTMATKLVGNQERILLQLKKIRKLSERDIKRRVTTCVPSTDTSSVAELEPVMYEDVNLVQMGARNLSSSEFGIMVARFLWSDTDLKNGLLCPRKKTASSRPPLDEERSTLFLTAVQKRFSDDDDAVATARDAVNQLGCDLRRGIRNRRAPLVQSNLQSV